MLKYDSFGYLLVIIIVTKHAEFLSYKFLLSESSLSQFLFQAEKFQHLIVLILYTSFELGRSHLIFNIHLDCP